MNKFNHLDLDGKLLTILVTILEKGSITKAAEEVGLTQSAISHAVEKLRAICNDPLFVKSGRNISPTEHAIKLGGDARKLLDQMQNLSQGAVFDPQNLEATFTIAANDLQRDLLLPKLLSRLNDLAPKVNLKIISSGIPSLELLRDQGCHLAITPRPPNGTDVFQKRIFEDHYVVFFDKKAKPPRSKNEYLSSDHISVAYDPPRPLAVDQYLIDQGIRRNFKVIVPGFAGIPAFLKGSNLLATLPSYLRANLLKDFDYCDPPVKCPTMPMYMVWHKKYQKDPTQIWLRNQLQTVINSSLDSQK